MGKDRKGGKNENERKAEKKRYGLQYEKQR